STAPPPVAPPSPVKPTAPPTTRPAREVVVDTPLYRAVFTEQGAALQSFQLKRYQESLPFQTIFKLGLWFFGLEVERYQDPNVMPRRLKDLVRAGAGELPLSLTVDGKTLSAPAGLLYDASQTELILKSGEAGTLSFSTVTPEGLAITKTFTFQAAGYQFDLKAKVVNQSSQNLEGHLDLALTTNFSDLASDQRALLGFLGSINNRLEDLRVGGKNKGLQTFTGKVDWATVDEGYFLMALVPQSSPKALVTVKEAANEFLTVTLRQPESLAPAQETVLTAALYFGPKDLDDLKAVNLGLERTVDFGWFDFLAKPLLYVLKFINRYVNNWGWSLVILTLITRLVFWYPNHKSYKSMKEMQKIQPKVAKIREKYKDDKETMNKELISLYRTFKVNPMAGCLPMFLQFPVFIALYNVLSYAIELRHAPFISTIPLTNIVWLSDLSAKDPLLISPLIMGASMFIQQQMTPSPGDPTQAKMMMFLPIVFTFLFLNFASGLVIYWLVNNILAIVQQHYTNKYLT
ncbi:MAG: membrane protein insertase YidC, partial [Deltaproteobacteria bacterium]|nr:membrane protein insertase YidC [Deltaproteobacteria bacterium]